MVVVFVVIRCHNVIHLRIEWADFDKTKKGQTETNTKQQLRHVVLFSFKSTSSADDVKRIEDAFRALPSKIKEVKGFEWGKNNSPEGLDQGFTHCFLVSFNAEKDREVYLPHPDHKAFVDVLKPHLDKVLVIDYWSGK